MSHEIRQQQLPGLLITRSPIQNTVRSLPINGCVYWMSSVVTDEKSPQHNFFRPYEDNEEGLVDCCEVESNYEILLTKSGKFMTSVYVPSSLLSYIIGPRAVKLKSLQKNTNTLIKVPKPNETGYVKITGDTERNVASAHMQIVMIVMQRKEKLPVTHFVSIPINSGSIKENMMSFKKQILEHAPKGVTASIFQKPEKLHLTICTLILVDEQELITAKKVLQSCYDDFISNDFKRTKKRMLIVQGLEIMNDDPFEANVLYCNVRLDDSDQNIKFQTVIDKIPEYFYKAGLARKQYDRVKLHVTLMNTNFRNTDEKPETFDATEILNKFRNYDFGTIMFNNIQLSIRFSSGDDKYYECALYLEI